MNPAPVRQRHPWAAVDVVIFRVAGRALETLLVRIKHGPFRDRWAFPGGLVVLGESLDEAARRELLEKTPIRDVYLEQLFTFGDPARNPARHVVSTAYFALLPVSAAAPQAGTKYAEAAWFDVTRLPVLAYDHNRIAAVALERLRAKIAYTNVAYGLLPRAFTLAELQRVYEVIRGRPLDRRNFRKRVLEAGLIRPVQRYRRGAHRPAALYAFRKRRLTAARRIFRWPSGVQKMLPMLKSTSPMDSPRRRSILKP
jgi:ADP-ribose pyrophosphatase YjhB (NUDIX family)